MCRRFFGFGKEASRLDHQFYPEIAPGNLRRVALRENLDGMPVHDQRVSRRFNYSGEAAIGGGIFQQTSVVFCIDKMINCDDINVAACVLKGRREGRTYNDAE